MENIFNLDLDDTTDVCQQPPKMTKDEFIKNTRSMLEFIMDGYSRFWEYIYNEQDESDDNICPRCHGLMHIEQGGDGDVDCPSCNGTGLNKERYFNTEEFAEFMEHDVIFGEQPFLNLLHCEIIDK